MGGENRAAFGALRPTGGNFSAGMGPPFPAAAAQKVVHTIL